MPEMNGIPVEIESAEKFIGSSRTINFNWLSLAVMPFLPDRIQHSPYALPAVAIWFATGNIALRTFTTKAVTWFRHKPPPVIVTPLVETKESPLATLKDPPASL